MTIIKVVFKDGKTYDLKENPEIDVMVDLGFIFRVKLKNGRSITYPGMDIHYYEAMEGKSD